MSRQAAIPPFVRALETASDALLRADAAGVFERLLPGLVLRETASSLLTIAKTYGNIDPVILEKTRERESTVSFETDIQNACQSLREAMRNGDLGNTPDQLVAQVINDVETLAARHRPRAEARARDEEAAKKPFVDPYMDQARRRAEHSSESTERAHAYGVDGADALADEYAGRAREYLTSGRDGEDLYKHAPRHGWTRAGARAQGESDRRG